MRGINVTWETAPRPFDGFDLDALADPKSYEYGLITLDHPRSSHGIPVLVRLDSSGEVLAPSDLPEGAVLISDYNWTPLMRDAARAGYPVQGQARAREE